MEKDVDACKSKVMALSLASLAKWFYKKALESKKIGLKKFITES